MRRHRWALGSAALVVASLLAAACTGGAATPRPNDRRQPPSSSKVGAIDPDAGIMNLDHLIFIVQENRS